MKHSSLLLFAVLIVGIMAFSCDDDEPESETLAFEATFFTDRTFLGPDSLTCTDPYGFFNVQEGSGSETTIGDFTTTISFCVNPATFEYVNSESSFIDANGDELFIDINGQVLPTTEPGYDLEFKDPFTIIGGTGRFEGATGSGMTNSFVNSTTQRTDHVWSGTITLKN